MYGAGTSAKNLIVQPTPDGEWMATAKISVSALNENYQQAGLRVWSDDNNWASVHMISAGGNRDFEFIYEANGNPRNEGADKLGGIPTTAPLDYYVRIVSDGENLNAFYSYDGVTFSPVGRPAPLSTFTDPQIGPAALSDLAPSVPMARFDWIRFDPDGTGGGGNERGRRVRGHDARRGLGAHPRRPERGRQRRHAADPGAAGRPLPDPQRRQEPDRPHRAERRLGGGGQAQLRGHRPVPPGRDRALRRRRQLHEVRPHRAYDGRRREVRVHLREQRHGAQRSRRFDGQHRRRTSRTTSGSG